MGFKNLLNVLGIGSEEDENEEYSDEYEEVENIEDENEDIAEETNVNNKYDDTIVTSRNVTQIAANKNVAQKRPMESSYRYRSNIETIKPAMYSDAHKIIEKLKTGAIIVFSLELITDEELAMRILDFVYGGTYALEGKIKEVGPRVYIVTGSDANLSEIAAQSLSEDESEDESGEY
ncbi:MAG: cell division protein SepF [Clostridiales bacterium]|nr:cell division protein SepF [Clostridiales bacterium]